VHAATERSPLLDIAGVAAYLATTERHVRRLVAERRIPHSKVGGLVRFRVDAIDRWLADNERGPAAADTLAPVQSMPRRRSAQTAPSNFPGQLRLES
jgi:excisionase family DNA binding protein